MNKKITKREKVERNKKRLKSSREANRRYAQRKRDKGMIKFCRWIYPCMVNIFDDKISLFLKQIEGGKLDPITGEVISADNVSNISADDNNNNRNEYVGDTPCAFG